MYELLPRAQRFAALVSDAQGTSAITDLRAAASAIGKPIQIFAARTNGDLDSGFATLAQEGVDGVLVSPFALADNRRVQLVTLAAHYRVPTMYAFREHVEAGGLMSYGSSAADRDRQVGLYAGRILKGEKPGDLPVIRAVKFEFVLNLQTAKTLGLTIPPTLLAIADEVIE